MSGSGEQSPGETRLGDYRLLELLSEGRRTRSYRAEQVSMNRAVILERVKEQERHHPEVVEGFLEDVRAKAAVDHPGIGSVYEAVEGADAVYYTREYLGGTTFDELREAGVTFLPATIATFLRQVGSAMEYLEANGFAVLPLEPRHLVLAEHDVVRLANLAVAGHDGAPPAGHDRHLLAELCLDLLKRGAPGATRMNLLLNMMADCDGTALSWTQIAHTSRKLEEDLSEGTMMATQAIKSGPILGAFPRRAVKRAVIGLLVGLLVAAVLAVAGLLWTNRKVPPRARDHTAMVEIPGGRYLTHEGKTIELPPFWIDAHEVTIAEYAGFLEALEGLPAEKRTAYDHPAQPSRKLDHIPDDWEAMLSAARVGGMMEGLPIDLNYPVTRVDWWDAWAYASWMGARLPTQEEWFAATQDGAVEPSGPGAVDRLPGDLTPRGIHGLAGNVSEWVRDPATNPAFPMNPKRPLACGASSLHPHNGARARTWVPNLETRRRDLGFRTARDTAP